MSRTRFRHIDITLVEDISDEEAEAFFERAIEACGCNDPEGEDCLLVSGSMTAYYYDDNGVPFLRPEGGLPTYTLDLDDHDDTEMCGEHVSIEDGDRFWFLTCLQPPHDGPHCGPITW